MVQICGPNLNWGRSSVTTQFFLPRCNYVAHFLIFMFPIPFYFTVGHRCWSTLQVPEVSFWESERVRDCDPATNAG